MKEGYETREIENHPSLKKFDLQHTSLKKFDLQHIHVLTMNNLFV